RLDGWLAEARSGLALVVVLDQFPRNVFRGSSLAFAHDEKALAASRTLIASGLDRTASARAIDDRELTPHQRMVLYLPFQHSEDRSAQVEGVARYEDLLKEVTSRGAAPAVIDAVTYWLDFARQHAILIERYGRFPHRNTVLGRATRPDEESYLETPGAGF
ncbi:MAG: DUF924 domain-containing protein, partial [Deltaproteobacteria bacterium]|nr:DUF924 domain-containing protein [Deltaproteobacteria bacterium]